MRWRTQPARRVSRVTAVLQSSLLALGLWAPALLGSAQSSAPVLRLLDAHNRELPSQHALGISRHITHDRSLTRSLNPHAESDDPENFRLELYDPSESSEVVYARIEAVAPDGARDGTLRHVPLLRLPNQARFRSPFIRLVTDATDASAPDIGNQLFGRACSTKCAL